MSSTFNVILATTGGAAVIGALDGIRNSLGGVAQAALGTTSLLAGVKSGLDLGGEFNDLSARTGQSVRDLVVFRRALDNAGVGGESAAQFIGLLQKAIGGLNEEGGKTDDVFKKLGLDPERLKNLGVSEQFAALTAGFAKIENPAERAATAMQLFGRSGAQMLQLLGDSGAMSTAADEAGRLAVRLQGNAASFDALGDKLSVAKVRLQEFWLVAAEKAVPQLTRMAELLNSFNPAPLAAAAGSVTAIFGFATGAKIVQKVDSAMQAWAVKEGAPIGQAFAAKFIAPMTGMFAKFLPLGLGAAIAGEVFIGLMNGYAEWRQNTLDASTRSLDGLKNVQAKARGISNEKDRQAALADTQAQIPETEAALEVEKSRFFFNRDDQAIATYQLKLDALRSTVKLLSSDWAGHTEQLNLAAKAAAKEAETEMGALLWLKSEEGQKMKDAVDAAEAAALSARERLDLGKANLAISDQSYASERKKYDATTQSHQIALLDLKAQSARLEILKGIAAAEAEINEEKKSALERRLAGLDADFGRTDASKWAERAQLISEATARQKQYIDNQRDLAKAAAGKGDDATAGIYTGNAKSGDSRLRDLEGQQAQLGPDPESLMQNLQASTMSFLNQIGTVSQQIGRSVASVWQSVASGLGTALTGLITKTMTWGQFMRSIGENFGMSVLNAFTKMVAEYAVSKAAMFALDMVFAAKSLALSIASAGKSLLAWLPSAIAASISSYGIAAAIGVAAVLAVVKGFAGGGMVDGGEQLVRINERGQEFVVSNPAVRRFGPAFLEDLNSGVLNVGALPGNVAEGLVNAEGEANYTPRGLSEAKLGVDTLDAMHAAARSGNLDAVSAATGGAAGGNATTATSPTPNVTVINVASDREATRIARRSQAAGDVVQIVRDNWSQITRRGAG